MRSTSRPTPNAGVQERRENQGGGIAHSAAAAVSAQSNEELNPADNKAPIPLQMTKPSFSAVTLVGLVVVLELDLSGNPLGAHALAAIALVNEHAVDAPEVFGTRWIFTGEGTA